MIASRVLMDFSGGLRGFKSVPDTFRGLPGGLRVPEGSQEVYVVSGRVSGCLWGASESLDGVLREFRSISKGPMDLASVCLEKAPHANIHVRI